MGKGDTCDPRLLLLLLIVPKAVEGKQTLLRVELKGKSDDLKKTQKKSVIYVDHFRLENRDLVKRSVHWFDQYFFPLRLDNSHQYEKGCISLLGAIILNTGTLVLEQVMSTSWYFIRDCSLSAAGPRGLPGGRG